MGRPCAYVPYFHVDGRLERRGWGGSEHRHLVAPRYPQVLQSEADDSREPSTLHSVSRLADSTSSRTREGFLGQTGGYRLVKTPRRWKILRLAR